MNSSPSRPLVGIFWMLVTGLCFVAVTALVKYMGDGIPPAEAAFLRYFLGLVFLLPMLPALREARLTARQWRLFSLRGVFHTGGVILWFFAMTRIPIAEVTAMNYLAPVYVSVGAALFLGERLALRRIAAIVVALVGTAVILRPGFRDVAPGHIAMLFCAVSFAGSYLVGQDHGGRGKACRRCGHVVHCRDHLPGAFCLGQLGHAHGCRAWVAVSGRLFCDCGSLHHDHGVCCGAGDGHTASDLSAACLGRVAGGSRFCRAGRHLGDPWRRADSGRRVLYHVARSGAETPADYTAQPGHKALAFLLID